MLKKLHIQAMDKNRFVFEAAKAEIGRMPYELGIDVANPNLDHMTIDVVEDAA